MTCSAASTLSGTSAPSLPPIQLPTSQGAWQRVRTIFQQMLQQIQAAAGSLGNNFIPQQYALIAGSTLPPIASTSNCTVTADPTTPLFGAGGSYKITITGTPATVQFVVDTAWPISPGWQWLLSFYQQASAAIAGAITITTPQASYTTDFTTTLEAQGFIRLFDALNLGADTSTTFGLSLTFTSGGGQKVWVDGFMLEPYFNVASQPSPFSSTSPPLTLDNQPDGSIYLRFLATYLDATRRVAAANGAISPLGSIPPGAFTVTFSYTSTTTSVTINWTSGIFYRSDGTTTNVNAGSQTITGLSASTTYFVPIYYNETTNTISFASAAGGIGTPAIAYTSQAASASGILILNGNATLGWYTVTTPASGSGGGGGLPTCCLNGGQLVELSDGSIVKARELKAGDSLQSENGPVRIAKLRIDAWGEWFRVSFSNGVTLVVAGDHRFIDPAGEEIRAHELKLQQILKARGAPAYVVGLQLIRVAGEKVSIEVQEPHTYYVQGLLSHNKFMC